MHGLSATRRTFLAAAAGAGAAMLVRPANATPESMKAAIRQIAGEAEVKPGKVKLDLPPQPPPRITAPGQIAAVQTRAL